MKTFKSYIAESRMTSLGEITAAIANHKKAGEILNPAYKNLSDQARRVFGKVTEAGRDLILSHLHAGNRTQELNDVYYAWPHDSFAGLGKLEKLVSKLKDSKFKNVVSEAQHLLKDWKPVAADLKLLKTKVVKVTQKRAEAKATAATAMDRKFADSSSLIKIFESHMKEYLDRARQQATDFVENKLDILKKHDWDLDKVAPRARSNMGRDAYMSAQNKRSLYTSITKSKSDSVKHGELYIVEPNPALIKHYIEMNVSGAEEAYKGFMQKMIQKIGKPVVDAKMTGNIWTDATLTVTTDDGEQQIWSTKMIINFSKYQKMFNQFPSRRKN